MIITGSDLGIHGGLAAICVDHGAAPRLIDAIDIPVIRTGAKERVDLIALRNWILRHQPQHAYVERAQAMPKQGSSSGFKYGRAVGAIEAAIALCGIPLTIVEPRHGSAHFTCAARTKKGVGNGHYNYSLRLTTCSLVKKITAALKRC
jgi:hypothetical protein